MRKKGEFLVLILLSFISLAFVSSIEINTSNVSIKENYTLGETLSGNFILRVSDIDPNYLLKTNLGHSIPLKDFLRNNSKQLDCESYNCQSSYSNSSGQISSMAFPISPAQKRIIGSRVGVSGFGQISKINLRLTLNISEGNSTPLMISLFEGAFNWSYQNFTENYNRLTSYGCYIPSQPPTGMALLASSKLCQKIENMPPTNKVLLGMNYTFGGGRGNPTINMSLHKEGQSDSIGECMFTTERNSSCIANLKSLSTIGDYFVCAEKTSEGKEVRVLMQDSNNKKCGSNSPSLSANPPGDYALFVKLPTYQAINGNIQIEIGNIGSVSEIYFRRKYSGGCSVGCFAPIQFSGITQDIEINSLESYVSFLGSTQIMSSFYNLTSFPAKGNFNGIVELSKADFKTESAGNKNLTVFLELENHQKTNLFTKTIRVASIPITIRNIFPSTIPAGVPSLIIANVFSSSPIISYQWIFGDGTTETTTENRVLKMYNNLTTYNLTLKVTNNLSESITKSVGITSINPRDYLNISIARKNTDLINLRNQIDLLDVPFKDKIKQALNLNELQSALNSIDAERTTTTGGDEVFLRLALRIQELEIPQSIFIEEKRKDILIANPSDIDLTQISALVGKTISDNEYRSQIVNWQVANIDGDKEQIKISILEGGIKKTFAFVYKIRAKVSERSFLVIQDVTDIDSSIALQQTDKSKTFELTADQEKRVELLYFGTLPLVIYISPEPGRIEIVGEVSPCNFNKICEASEDYKNCRSDCKPWSIMIALMIVLFILFISAYIFMQVYFKKRYELNLFKSEQDLTNLIESINNSKENKLSERETTEKLIKNGWSKEQVLYAIKKSKGKRTRPYEIIPMDRILNAFKTESQNKPKPENEKFPNNTKR